LIYLGLNVTDRRLGEVHWLRKLPGLNQPGDVLTREWNAALGQIGEANKFGALFAHEMTLLVVELSSNMVA
jgi:hypothetical protein